MVCVEKLVEHSYHTSSKANKSSFPDHCLSKGEGKMIGNDEDNALAEITVSDNMVVEQSKILHNWHNI